MRRAIIFTLWLICVTGYTALLLYDFRLAGLAMAVLALFAIGLSGATGLRSGYTRGFREGGHYMLEIIEKESDLGKKEE